MGTLSAGSAATNIQPSVSAVSAYAPSRPRLEWYCESEVALMTITGQSRAVSKFSGTAIVTSACMTGDRCPRPANCRSSLGSSTWNWLKPPFVRPVAASVAEATNNAGSNARNRFISTSVGIIPCRQNRAPRWLPQMTSSTPQVRHRHEDAKDSPCCKPLNNWLRGHGSSLETHSCQMARSFQHARLLRRVDAARLGELDLRCDSRSTSPSHRRTRAGAHLPELHNL